MIVESMVDLCVGLVVNALYGANLLGIPVNGIQVLATFCSYGSYVVGSDLLLTFAGCVAAWMMLKLQIGILLFIWRLLPLT